jgi:hypothetical protein
MVRLISIAAGGERALDLVEVAHRDANVLATKRFPGSTLLKAPGRLS